MISVVSMDKAFAEIQINEKYYYDFGDVMIVSGKLVGYDNFLFKDNGIEQEPIKIDIYNTMETDPHVFEIRIFPNCVNGFYPNCDYTFNNSLSLSSAVGFVEGIYNLSVSYGNDVISYDFGVGIHSIDTFKAIQNQNITLEIIEKQFVITTDKPKYAFGDRLLSTGFLKGYDSNSIYDRNIVNIKIVDDKGKTLESEFKSKFKSGTPSLYEFKVFPRTGDGYAINQDIGINDLKRLKSGEYRFSISITPLDFIENKTYNIIATYGKEKIETSFIVYDKFANMKNVFEIYHKDKLYSLGDTVTITGLAPYAVGGAGQSKIIIGFDSNNKAIIKRSSSSGDNHYVMYTITRPDGEIKTGQVKVENGEFTINYKISEYPHSDGKFDKYTVKTQWTSHYQYLSFVVIK